MPAATPAGGPAAAGQRPLSTRGLQHPFSAHVSHKSPSHLPIAAKLVNHSTDKMWMHTYTFQKTLLSQIPGRFSPTQSRTTLAMVVPWVPPSAHPATEVAQIPLKGI